MQREIAQATRVRKLRRVLTLVAQARASLELMKDRDLAEDEACRLIGGRARRGPAGT